MGVATIEAVQRVAKCILGVATRDGFAIVKAESAMNNVCLILMLGVLARTICAQVSPPVPTTDDVDLAELAKNKADWPAEVTLLKAFAEIGDRGSILVLPYGAKLKLIEVQGKQIKVAYREETVLLPAKYTDLVEQVRLARRVRAVQEERNKLAGVSEETNGPPANAASEIDLAAVAKNKADWPVEVALTEKVTWPVVIGGKEKGTTELPSGTTVKLVEVLGDQIRVTYTEATKLIPAKATDLIPRVISKRRATETKAKIDEAAGDARAEETQRNVQRQRESIEEYRASKHERERWAKMCGIVLQVAPEGLVVKAIACSDCRDEIACKASFKVYSRYADPPTIVLVGSSLEHTVVDGDFIHFSAYQEGRQQYQNKTGGISTAERWISSDADRRAR